MSNAIQVIFPYQDHGVWMFDDQAKGLVREPFVCGIPEMVELLVAKIQDPDKGFALYFSNRQFPNYQLKVDLVEPEAGGNWYKHGRHRNERLALSSTLPLLRNNATEHLCKGGRQKAVEEPQHHSRLTSPNHGKPVIYE